MSNYPLTAVLSQAFAAFVMESDNEAEHRMPHRTTVSSGPAHAPWLVSTTMYWNCLHWLDDEGVSVQELERRARTRTNVDGMRRWGYVRIEPRPPDGKTLKRDSRLAPTVAGKMAREVWRPIFAAIEDRWAERFGAGRIVELSDALGVVAQALGPGQPYCMPILRFGLALPARTTKLDPHPEDADAARLLGVRLARALLGIARSFEDANPLSLCVHANILRVLDLEPVRVSDVPRLCGISKQAVQMGVGVLRKRGVARQAKSSGGGQEIWLTPAGWEAKQAGTKLLDRVERAWLEQDAMKHAMKVLQDIVGTGRRGDSNLFQGLAPYPEGWRANAKPCEVLPHFPAVLHRGGFPDGV